MFIIDLVLSFIKESCDLENDAKRYYGKIRMEVEIEILQKNHGKRTKSTVHLTVDLNGSLQKW